MVKHSRAKIFIKDILNHTPFVKAVVLLVILWFCFSAAMFFAESGAQGSGITTFGEALYWSVAACSTAGIAPVPVLGISKLIGGIWIIVGSALFFGTIVATITTYFMRPLQRPDKQIIEIIEYNLEQLETLSIEELDLLRETVEGLISHMEYLKERHPTKTK
ncbi:two pore domain potassium channel family protein [Neptunomonas antarctica]|uniref:Voltage-gated potassium channel n=1 Tax=Neptunomonas antarctica TaxID=619304 RepID=A0A1N7KAN9_9GAMM|nr:two pore domain potassium channel family protein [Neptunomonas antarctica]SIS58666.1 voltage-gated potassium channel [Neptunomonas antarctica]